MTRPTITRWLWRVRHAGRWRRLPVTMTDAEAEKFAAAYAELRPLIEKVAGSERDEPILEGIPLMPSGGPRAPGF